MGLYVFAFDDLFPKRWIELNNLDMLKIYHLFLIRILSKIFIQIQRFKSNNELKSYLLDVQNFC